MEQIQKRQISVQSVRAILIESCKRHLKEGLKLTEYDADPCSLYQQYWKRQICLDLMEVQLIQEKKSVEQVERLFSLIKNDFNRVTLEAAIVAWLTIDDFKLHVNLNSPDTPEDLNYGLILQHYIPITKAASFISGISYQEDKESVPKEWINMAHDNAIRNIQRKYPNKSAEEIERIVSIVKM